MPHAELRYSSDLKFDAAALLARIETVILSHDSGAGDCKGRAYPADTYHHSHILVTVSLLTKPHRGPEFTEALMSEVEQEVKAVIKAPCAFSLAVEYAGPYYVTNTHAGQGVA